ncbi:hypothetical protein [Gordonia otitidis]|uniref:Uncharacterized protein n=1 Tax=Gordonia otitidis (strain DSM 44809 / CCUG 52243 / JCM 12355 / NBRC 100426 / IFM 10032) TaxID=1108044 RepID=H5TSD0_GORO1|nr:hypothetical protein [Gordonia otitidis]GAB36388.1 hypothetical protein GOOTI_214_00140 [Gordonia otitidis NBRC 100426]
MMDALFDLPDDARTDGTLFGADTLDVGHQTGTRALNSVQRSITYQPRRGGSLITAEVFCDGPLDNTVWALHPDGDHVVVSTATFIEIAYTPEASS